MSEADEYVGSELEHNYIGRYVILSSLDIQWPSIYINVK